MTVIYLLLEEKTERDHTPNFIRGKMIDEFSKCQENNCDGEKQSLNTKAEISKNEVKLILQIL